MARIYALLIILAILGGCGYGVYLYYKDTQARIATLRTNNANLESSNKSLQAKITAMNENATREGSPARKEHAAKEVTMPQLIHDTMSTKDIGLPYKRNKLATCQVIWGGSGAINEYDAQLGDSNPWSVLRSEDDKSMRNALKILLERNVLSVEPSEKTELMAWRANN